MRTIDKIILGLILAFTVNGPECHAAHATSEGGTYVVKMQMNTWPDMTHPRIKIEVQTISCTGRPSASSVIQAGTSILTRNDINPATGALFLAHPFPLTDQGVIDYLSSSTLGWTRHGTRDAQNTIALEFSPADMTERNYTVNVCCGYPTNYTGTVISAGPPCAALVLSVASKLLTDNGQDPTTGRLSLVGYDRQDISDQQLFDWVTKQSTIPIRDSYSSPPEIKSPTIRLNFWKSLS